MSDAITPDSIKHAPGTFCWAELLTTDGAAAKAFYQTLLGLETNDDPIPDGGTYTMMSIAGGHVGGMWEINDEMKQQGVPSHWMSYVSVVDADATAARATELGGAVIREPFDVMEFGRMATIQDPSDAAFSIWQPKLHQGFGHAEPRNGTICWNELATKNIDACGSFYAGLFEWTPTVQDMGGGTSYTIFKSGDAMRAGMVSMQGDEYKDAPSHWNLYFTVEDCPRTVEKVTELGGAIQVPMTQIPGMGRFSIMSDPTGAAFSVIDSHTGM